MARQIVATADFTTGEIAIARDGEMERDESLDPASHRKQASALPARRAPPPARDPRRPVGEEP
jgi:hypothetical protein